MADTCERADRTRRRTHPAVHRRVPFPRCSSPWQRLRRVRASLRLQLLGSLGARFALGRPGIPERLLRQAAGLLILLFLVAACAGSACRAPIEIARRILCTSALPPR